MKLDHVEKTLMALFFLAAIVVLHGGALQPEEAGRTVALTQVQSLVLRQASLKVDIALKDVLLAQERVVTARLRLNHRLDELAKDLGIEAGDIERMSADFTALVLKPKPAKKGEIPKGDDADELLNRAKPIGEKL